MRRVTAGTAEGPNPIFIGSAFFVSACIVATGIELARKPEGFSMPDVSEFLKPFVTPEAPPLPLTETVDSAPSEPTTLSTPALEEGGPIIHEAVPVEIPLSDEERSDLEDALIHKDLLRSPHTTKVITVSDEQMTTIFELAFIYNVRPEGTLEKFDEKIDLIIYTNASGTKVVAHGSDDTIEMHDETMFDTPPSKPSIN